MYLCNVFCVLVVALHVIIHCSVLPLGSFTATCIVTSEFSDQRNSFDSDRSSNCYMDKPQKPLQKFIFQFDKM